MKEGPAKVSGFSTGKCQVLPQAGMRLEMPVEEQLWGMPGVPVGTEWDGSQVPMHDSHYPARASLAEVAGQSGWSTHPVKNSPRQGGIIGADG